jgi:hypothetical protein
MILASAETVAGHRGQKRCFPPFPQIFTLAAFKSRSATFTWAASDALTQCCRGTAIEVVAPTLCCSPIRSRQQGVNLRFFEIGNDSLHGLLERDRADLSGPFDIDRAVFADESCQCTNGSKALVAKRLCHPDLCQSRPGGAARGSGF